MSKDVLTNKEQLYESFRQMVKEQKFKAKKMEGGQFDTPPPLEASGVKDNEKYPGCWTCISFDAQLQIY